MGLNRSEELLLDYVQRNPDERHHWQAKVQMLGKTHRNRHELASALEAELRRYYDERRQTVKRLAEIVSREGLLRPSLRNLAEYLLQVWAPLPVKTAEVNKTKKS